MTFPRGNKADGTFTYRQEVVKLDVLQTPAPLSSTNDQYNNSVVLNNHFETGSKALKVNLPYGSVEIPNGTDPALLEATLRILGGMYAR